MNIYGIYVDYFVKNPEIEAQLIDKRKQDLPKHQVASADEENQ